MTNREWYKRTFDALVSSDHISLEAENIMRNRRRKNKVAVAAIVMAAAIGMGGITYAAHRYYGLLDFARDSTDKIPQEATEMIDAAIVPDKVEETDGNIMDCTVREALCDSETIMVAFEVSAKEAGKYLFIPEYAVPSDNMSDWSDVKGITASEYAKEKGLQIVNISGGITNFGELGIAESSLIFKSAGDDVMDVYVRSGKTNDAKSLEVECQATARFAEGGYEGTEDQAEIIQAYGKDNDNGLSGENVKNDFGSENDEKELMEGIMRKYITFTLQDMSTVNTKAYSVAGYVPAKGNGEVYSEEIMGNEAAETDMLANAGENGANTITVNGAKVLDTELGTYIDISFTSSQGEYVPDDLTFRILDKNGSQIDSVGGSGIEVNSDGTMFERFIFNKMEVGDSFMIEVYDYEDNVVCGSFEMIAE